jgi:hypothetical protein
MKNMKPKTIYYQGKEKKQDQQQKETTEKNNQTPQPNNKQKNELTTKGQAYDLINQRDDEQVLLELRGGFLDEFVYSFPTKEGRVTGLSWAGVKEVARQMGNISITDLDITETDTTYRVKAKAKDMDRNVTMFGVTEQTKQLMLRTGETQADTHALSKCVSRAQRNAIRGLIPEMFIKEMIEKYRNNGGSH